MTELNKIPTSIKYLIYGLCGLIFIALNFGFGAELQIGLTENLQKLTDYYFGISTNTLDYVGDTYGTNWSTQCKLDEMDDTHWCSLDREDLRIGIWKDGTPFVTVGNSHYPSSNIAVRVDKNKSITAPESTGFTKDQSIEIISQLKKGQSVLSRYQEWPYQSNKDKSLDLFGFPQAWAILQKIHESVGTQQ